MKLSSRKVGGRKVELMMTPMIDVVFQLLIFFMCTAAFVRTERHLDPAIQVRRQGAAAASHLEPAIVEVTHGDTGFVYKIGNRQLSSQDELTGVLKKFDNKVDGAFVRAADDAPYGMAAAAIQACKSAGFLSVSYVPLDP